MISASLPHADDVGGDLIEGAKHLAMLNWTEPALVVSRLALENTVNAMVEANDARHRAPERAKFRHLGRALRRKKVITQATDNEIACLYYALSKYAHGEKAPLRVAVPLIERTQSLLEVLNY